MTKRIVTEEDGRYYIRQGGTFTEVSPGGSGNATSIRGRAVSSATPGDGDSYRWSAQESAWVPSAGGSGGVPEAPNDGKIYGRKSLGWTETTASSVGADTSGAAATVQGNLETHAGLASSVHGFDSAGKAPPQSHDNGAHSTTYAAASALTSHTGNTSNPHSVTAAQAGAEATGTASAAVSAHLSGAPHLADAPADGTQYARKNNAWEAAAGGSGLTHQQVMARTIMGF
jgi:hypothetical protein